MTKIILCVILAAATLGSFGFAFLGALADSMADDHLGGDKTPDVFAIIGLLLLVMTIVEVWKG